MFYEVGVFETKSRCKKIAKVEDRKKRNVNFENPQSPELLESSSL